MIRSLNSSLENGTWHNIKLGRLHKSHCINIGEWAKWAHIERPETRKTRSYWSAHGRDYEELNFSDKENENVFPIFKALPYARSPTGCILYVIALNLCNGFCTKPIALLCGRIWLYTCRDWDSETLGILP